MNERSYASCVRTQTACQGMTFSSSPWHAQVDRQCLLGRPASHSCPVPLVLPLLLITVTAVALTAQLCCCQLCCCWASNRCKGSSLHTKLGSTSKDGSTVLGFSVGTAPLLGPGQLASFQKRRSFGCMNGTFAGTPSQLMHGTPQIATVAAARPLKGVLVALAMLRYLIPALQIMHTIPVLLKVEVACHAPIETATS